MTVGVTADWQVRGIQPSGRSIRRPTTGMWQPMVSNREFFESPQAAAIYKHKLLKSYIPAWAGKVGSTAAANSVFVYDAYSGPGRYKNEQPGSPELLVDTAVAMANLRKVHTVFSEKDQAYCDRLEAMLEEKGVDAATYEVRRGPVDHHVDDVLRLVNDLPLFVFLDPFGLTISFDRVIHILKSRDNPSFLRAQQPKTELLMNFSYEAVRRIAGVIRSDKKYAAREGQIRALDKALGGAWWHDLARSEEEGWVEEVLTGFADRVIQVAECSYVTASVADSLEAQPVYELILFTHHMDGLWEMLRSMSMARKEWRQYLFDKQEKESGGQAEIRGLQFDDDEEAWIEDIASNIKTILQTNNSFMIEEKVDVVFGRTMGLARETHIRSALKKLAAEGVIDAVPKGKLQRAFVSLQH